MSNLNGSGSEKSSLSDFEAQLQKLRSQQADEDLTDPVQSVAEAKPLPAPAGEESTVAPVEQESVVTPAKEESAVAPVPEKAASASTELPANPPKNTVRKAKPRPAQSASTQEPQRKRAEGGSGEQRKRTEDGSGEQRKKRPATAAAKPQKKTAEAEKAPVKQPVRKKSRPIDEIEDDDEYLEKKRNTPAKGFFRFLGRTLVTILATALLLVVGLAAAIIIVCRGPSVSARNLFVNSTNETSALKTVPRYFLPNDVVDSILHPVVEEVEPDSFVELATESETLAKAEEGEQELVVVSEEAAEQELELIDIKGSTFKGKMLIIHDPYKVKLAALDQFGEYGIYLTEFIEKYGAIAGTNAGGFYDPNGMGNGGTPDGLVIRDGKLAFGSLYSHYVDVIGFDSSRVLHVGDMTAQAALDLGIVEGISFSAGPVLIQNGVKRTNLGGGVNPRTCIGQRADGAIILVVLEGRHPDSLGATYDDIADLMEEYGAVNAANLDGGSSSTMVYNGEQITKGSNIVGTRRIATAILVLP